MKGERKNFKHASYGMIGVSRITGDDRRPMFGSTLESNPTRIMIRVYQGEREFYLGKDWYRADGRLPLIEVLLTPAQFAEMLSNPNHGDGVPCTITSVGGESIERTPVAPSAAAEVRRRYEEETAELREKAREGAERVAKALDGAKLSAKVKDAILKEYREAVRFLDDSAPFLVKSFQEATQKTVTEAKLEIDAFTMHAIHAAGLEALAEKRVMLETGRHREERTLPPLIGTSGQEVFDTRCTRCLCAPCRCDGPR